MGCEGGGAISVTREQVGAENKKNIPGAAFARALADEGVQIREIGPLFTTAASRKPRLDRA